MITPLLFLILGGGFTGSLLMGIMKLLNYDWKESDNNGFAIIKLFKWTIIFFILFILFVSYGISFLESNNIK